MLSPIPQMLLCHLSRPTSPASLTSKGTWCSSSACPCKDCSSWSGSQNSTDGVLDTKLQGPVSSSFCSLLLHSLFYTACWTLPFSALPDSGEQSYESQWARATPSLFSALLAPSLLCQQEDACPNTKAKIPVTTICRLHTQITQKAVPRPASSSGPTSARPAAHTQGRGSCYQTPVTQNSWAWVGQPLLTPAGGWAAAVLQKPSVLACVQEPGNKEAPQEVPMKSAPKVFICLSCFSKSAHKPY